MRDYEKIETLEKRSKEVVKSVTCNKCGKTKEIEGSDDVEREWSAEEFQSIGFSFGYGSGYDGERWQFDLCEDCLTDFIKTFKHVPNGFGEDGYFAQHPQCMFEKWKETGIVDLEAGMTEEEIEKRGGSIYSDGEE